MDGLSDGRHQQCLKVAEWWLDKLRDMVEGIVAQYAALGRGDRAALWTQQWVSTLEAIAAGTASDFEFVF